MKVRAIVGFYNVKVTSHTVATHPTFRIPNAVMAYHSNLLTAAPWTKILWQNGSTIMPIFGRNNFNL